MGINVEILYTTRRVGSLFAFFRDNIVPFTTPEFLYNLLQSFRDLVRTFFFGARLRIRVTCSVCRRVPWTLLCVPVSRESYTPHLVKGADEDNVPGFDWF